MTITCNLGDSAAAKIARHMRADGYKNPEDVVDAALDALDQIRADAEEIRRLIAAADADVAAGRVASYDGADEFVADVIAGGEARLSRGA